MYQDQNVRNYKFIILNYILIDNSFIFLVTALFKRGCHEIPDVMCSGFMALVGVVFLGFGCYRSVKYDVDNKVYKKFFTGN